jgi:hypothetical protein
VQNGSFENPKNTWVDAACNYMSVFAGSGAIHGWTVAAGTVNEIVWAKTLTCDNHTAANGIYLLDLTGFGSDSSNGAVQQTLHNLVIGQDYSFSMDVISDGMLPLVTLDTAPVPLTAGTPFVEGSDTWTPETGTYTAQSTDPVLTLQNQQAGQDINWIDNVIILPLPTPNLVQNGSFENSKSTWVDTSCNYMSLLAGSEAIPGWKVAAATVNEIVWAKTLSCDGTTAAKGTYYLDLTGFGTDSPNGVVHQTLHKLVIGQVYSFSMDVISDGMLPAVTVGKAAVPLTAGTPFVKGTDTWTPQSGTFTAQSTAPVLKIQNQQAGQYIDYIDNVIVTAR